MLMGIATFLVAFVPGYASIGIWGAIILTVLRMLQGIGVGGEWGGSVLISMEWARGHGNRGLVAAWPQFGVPSGLFLSNLVILAVSARSGADFATWGWRVPFFLSIIPIGIGLWIRLGILETPVFQQLVATRKIERAPILEVMRKQPREIILSALLRMAEQAPFYIFTAFVFAYGVGTLKMSRDLILSAVLVASCVSFITIPLAGHISDRIGRRNMYLIGAAATGLFGFLYFGMLDTAFRQQFSLRSCSRSFRMTSNTVPRLRLSRRRSHRVSATVGRRSATNSPRSSPAVRRRSSRPRCLPHITRATLSRSTSPPAQWSASYLPV
jgi:MFS family permease